MIREWLVEKFTKKPPIPDLTPIVREGERERRRTARVVTNMERESRRRQELLKQYASWEELLTGPRR